MRAAGSHIINARVEQSDAISSGRAAHPGAVEVGRLHRMWHKREKLGLFFLLRLLLVLLLLSSGARAGGAGEPQA